MTTFGVDPTKITKGLDVLRTMKSLPHIGGLSPSDFWKKCDAGEFGKPAGK
jgi:hypothetical protein